MPGEFRIRRIIFEHQDVNFFFQKGPAILQAANIKRLDPAA
jgi:hypothetical protein